MALFTSNLKTLRKYKELPQAALAQELELTRSTLSAYENGTASPNINTLVRIADYFKISLDRLLRQDLTTLTRFELKRIESGYDQDLQGKHLRILATTVNEANDEQTELITDQAKAGYTAGYADPEYIKELPRISLPFLARDQKHRAFPITGDSMPPVSSGSIVIATYIEDWTMVKNDTACIVVTRDDGIVFKLVTNQLDTRGSLLLASTNPSYEPYEVGAGSILEVWAFKSYISKEIPPPYLDKALITETLLNLQRDVATLKAR